MIRILALVVLLGTLAVRAETVESWPALLNAEEMRGRYATPGLRIVDLRDSAAYRAGHADGAVSMPLGSWREAAREDRLPALIGDAGIHPERPLLLVVEDTTLDNLTGASWVIWELKARGIDDVSLLEGGMRAWVEQGLPMTDRVHRHRTYRLPYQRAPMPLDEHALEEIRLGLAEGGLVEARTGGGGQPRPGAAVVSLDTLVGPDADLSDPVHLLERMKNAPMPWGRTPMVVFGDTPEAATALWFLASEVLGIEGIVVTPETPLELGLAGMAAGDPRRR